MAVPGHAPCSTLQPVWSNVEEDIVDKIKDWEAFRQTAQEILSTIIKTIPHPVDLEISPKSLIKRSITKLFDNKPCKGLVTCTTERAFEANTDKVQTWTAKYEDDDVDRDLEWHELIPILDEMPYDTKHFNQESVLTKEFIETITLLKGLVAKLHINIPEEVI